MQNRPKQSDSAKFMPALKYYDLELMYLGAGKSKNIENTEIYNLVRALTDLAEPTFKDNYDQRWVYFYMPAKRSGRLISVPFVVAEYRELFYLAFQKAGRLDISKGDQEVNEEYKQIFEESLRFALRIKKDKNILKRTVPYDLRTGKIKGKYVLSELMSELERKRILNSYEKHLEKGLEVSEISLNDYLNTAATGYKAAYKEAKGISPEEMYKKWADGRDCDMLKIKNKKSKSDFRQWLKTKANCGGHPFEIVFSWHRHGIHLYPPHSSNNYELYVTNYAFAKDFTKMTKALIREKVPFKTKDLEDVLTYLTGEEYFTVNEHSEHSFDYIPSKEYKDRYFYKIEWDALQVPEWKQDQTIKQ